MSIRIIRAAWMAIFFGAACVPVRAQLLPWLTYADSSSASVCEVINANNVELVVLANTRELTIVTGRDVILADTEVDIDRNVYFEGRPAGFITYAVDGDGFRTLWWVSLTGRVVDVDPFTGEPGETNLFPDDYRNVGCDACDFWDDQVLCAAIPGPPVCGNDVVEAGESCDDGNLDDGDGCSADCRIELPTINIRFCASGLIPPMLLMMSILTMLKSCGYRVRNGSGAKIEPMKAACQSPLRRERRSCSRV